jgi:rSAM/selenodomain-associated transferase 1
VVLSRWPAPGRCKRRLAATLGDGRAAAIQGRLTHHSLAAARQACRAAARDGDSGRGRPELVLAVSGLAPRAAQRWGARLGADRVLPQGEGSLGVRMQRQMEWGLRRGAPWVVLIGSDLPLLSAADLLDAFAALERAPLVLGPAEDGGYWLVGLRRRCGGLFAGDAEPIRWGGATVLAQTLATARRAGLAPALLPRRADLDRPADLGRWR